MIDQSLLLRGARVYDAVGSKASELVVDAVIVSYTYDNLNRQTNGSETRQRWHSAFTQHYNLNADGTRKMATETQMQPDGSTITRTTTWTYDADGRLTGESVSSGDSSEDYTDMFEFDLVGNRMKKAHTGPGGGASETITYEYNGDNQLTTQTSSLNGETDFTYDDNGSQLTSTNGSIVTSYTYDVRNKMVAVTTASGTTTYVYNDAGERVQEASDGVTTFYLTDEHNPTGYSQPLEEWTSTAGTLATASLARTYFLGDHVFGQADGSGTVSFLLTDGHGSSRLLTDASGTITEAYAYDAYGTATTFDASAAGTEYLFGGDALYDAISGLYLHGNGIRYRNGFYFMERDDQGYGRTTDPISLHNYLYAGANPVINRDPSGHDFSIMGLATATGIGALLGGIIGGAVGAAKAYAQGAANNMIWYGALQGAEVGALWGAGLGAGAYLATAALSQVLLSAIVNTSVATATPLEIATANTLAQTFVGFNISIASLGLNAKAYMDAVSSGNNVDAKIALVGMVMSGLGAAGARVGTYSAAMVPTPQVYVIGRQPDTAPFVGKMGFNVLNVPQNEWNMSVNDAWVQSAIHSRSPVLFESAPELESFFNTNLETMEHYPTTVTSHEVNQLLDAGYKTVVVGEKIWLVPK